MSYLLSIVLAIYMPLLPANLPANQIYMGAGISPIETINVADGWIADGEYQVMTVYNFIRLKSALEGSPDLCAFTVGEALTECQKGIQREQAIYQSREADDQLIIKSYENRLQIIEDDLQKAHSHNKMLMYIASSLGALAAASLTLHIVSSK